MDFRCSLRHRLALGEANGGVVLRQCDDPRAGILGQTAEPSGPGRPVGAEHLTAGIHDRLLPVPADDRRHRGEGDILEVAGPEFYLLRVVEDVDAGAQLGERGGVGGGPAQVPLEDVEVDREVGGVGYVRRRLGVAIMHI